MTTFKVAIIVGSLRKESFNLKLAKALANLGKDSFESQFLQIGDLPLFNQDLEANFPAQVTRLKNDIMSADGVLLVTPEYNRGTTAPMKNALDWASRPYGANAFVGKPTAICGTSPGAIGTACAQHNLRSTLGYLDVILMGQPEMYLQFKDGLIDSDGNISNSDTKKFLQGFVDKFADWIERHHISLPSIQDAKRASA